MRWIARVLTAALLAAAVTAAAGVTAPGIAGAASTPADEAVFLSKINALRGSQGLAPLSADPALAATSCTWNDQLIVANALSHDPNLSAAIASVEPNWRKGGENVGMGGTLDSLFDAFVASPGHYKNLVDPDYSRVGICSARSATGKLFTTHRFLGVRSSPAPPPPPPPTPAPPPPTTPAPPPPTPAPTAPPTMPTPTTPAPTAPAPTTPAPTAAPAPAPTAPPAPPPTPAPTPPASTAAPTTPTPPLSTAATASAALGTAPSGSESPDPTDPSDVRALVSEILEGFPDFLHLRLP